MCLVSGVPQPDILRTIVIRVHLVATLQTTEVFSVAVVLVREPTIRPRTALRRVRVVRVELLHRDTPLRRFVLDVLVEASERPKVVPLRVWKPLSNVR